MVDVSMSSWGFEAAKKGALNKRFKTRYFFCEVDQRKISYFVGEADAKAGKVPKGTISVESIEQTSAEELSIVDTSRRVYTLSKVKPDDVIRLVKQFSSPATGKGTAKDGDAITRYLRKLETELRANEARQKKEAEVARAQLKGVFDSYDKDGDGSLSLEEIESVFAEINMPKGYGAKVFQDIDANNDGSISFDELYLYVQQGNQLTRIGAETGSTATAEDTASSSDLTLDDNDLTKKCLQVILRHYGTGLVGDSGEWRFADVFEEAGDDEDAQLGGISVALQLKKHNQSVLDWAKLSRNVLTTDYGFDPQVLEDLMVDRQGGGEMELGFMVTDEFVGVIIPEKTYNVSLKGVFQRTEAAPKLPRFLPTRPPLLSLPNTWIDVDHSESSYEKQLAAWMEARFASTMSLGDDGLPVNQSNNVLGSNSIMRCSDRVIVIPEGEPTPENLAYYGVHLLRSDGDGQLVCFDTPMNIPITVMTVGDEYVDAYLLEEEKGGGFYVEYHNTPHLHMPMEESCGGFLILGKIKKPESAAAGGSAESLLAGTFSHGAGRDKWQGSKSAGVDRGTVELTAFRIPHGTAIYTPPWTVHCDAFLTGRYTVAYTATDQFQTALLMTPKPKDKRASLTAAKATGASYSVADFGKGSAQKFTAIEVNDRFEKRDDEILTQVKVKRIVRAGKEGGEAGAGAGEGAEKKLEGQSSSWLVGANAADAGKKKAKAKGLGDESTKSAGKKVKKGNVSARGTMFRGVGDNNISMRQRGAASKQQNTGGVTSSFAATSMFSTDFFASNVVVSAASKASAASKTVKAYLPT